MTNDLSTLSGALLEMKDQLIYELGQKGVTASYDSSTGLLGLIGRISDIQTGGGGSCYHIELDESSYTTRGTLTVSVTVQKNYALCVGETVTFTSSASTTTTATTNSNGVATATITFSASTTLTASIGGASDTATVSVSTGLPFYDDCTSATGLSNYGTLHKLRAYSYDGELAYDSTKNAYKFTTTTANNDGFCDIPILPLDNQDGYYVEAEFFTEDSTTGGQSGLIIYPKTDSGGNGVFFRDIASINRCGVLRFANWQENSESGNSQQSTLPVYNNWYRVRIEVSGTSVTAKWLKTDGTQVYSTNYTLPYTSGEMRVGLCFLAKFTDKKYYVRNIKAEYL